MARLVIFVGLPASGKSTYFKRYLEQTHILVSKDLMGSSKNKDKIQAEMLCLHLGSNKDTVVDNTNVSKAIRAPLVALAHDLGQKVEIYWFDTPAKICIQQNELRSGKARVPNVAIYTLAKKFEQPNDSEGADKIVRIWKYYPVRVYKSIEGAKDNSEDENTEDDDG